MVQVRQKVSHKRTFLFLEQLILKHGAQKDTISVKEVKDGLDFFYAQRSHAIRMTEFLAGVVPTRYIFNDPIILEEAYSNYFVKEQSHPNSCFPWIPIQIRPILSSLIP